MNYGRIHFSVRASLFCLLILIVALAGTAWAETGGGNQAGNSENSAITGEEQAYFGGIKGQVSGGTSGTAAIHGLPGALVAVRRVEGLAAGQASASAGEMLEALGLFPGTGGGSGQPGWPGLRMSSWYVRWAVSDASGNFSLAGLPPGIYYLGAVADWYQPVAARILVTAGKVTEQDLILAGPAGALGGRVVGFSGAGVDRATVLALPQALADGSSSGPQVEAGSGARVELEADGSMVLRRGEVSFRLAAGAEGELQGGSGFGEAEKQLLLQLAPYQARTDADGYYFMSLVEPGSYWVLAFKDGVYAYREVKIEVGKVTRADFRLVLPEIAIQPLPGSMPPQIRPNSLPPIKVFVRGRLLELDVEPLLEDGRVLVPLRALAEALGAEVDWDGKATITIKKNQIAIKLQTRGQVAYKGNSAVRLDVPARETRGRTLVPLRFVGEAMGAEVKWDAAQNTVLVQ